MAVADPTMALGMALRLHVATSHLPVADIVQTRVLLESWAASRASPDFAALEAAGNVVVSVMLGSLREAVKDDDRPGAADLVTAR